MILKVGIIFSLTLLLNVAGARVLAGDQPTANCNEGSKVVTGYGVTETGKNTRETVTLAVARMPSSFGDKFDKSFCYLAEVKDEDRIKQWMKKLKKDVNIDPSTPFGENELKVKCNDGNYGYVRPSVYALTRFNEDFLYSTLEDEKFPINKVFKFQKRGKGAASGTLLDWMDYWAENSDNSKVKEYVKEMRLNFWDEFGARKSCELNGTCKCKNIDDEKLECTASV